MHVVVAAGPLAGDVTLTVRRADATVADLAACLALEPSELLVAGRRVSGGTLLAESGVHEGARVGPVSGGGAASRTPAAGVTAVRVVAGLHAGEGRLIPPGGVLLGRAPDCDLGLASETVSDHHARLELGAAGGVVVHDLGSHNGTWLGDEPAVGATPVPAGGLIRMGAVQLEVGPMPTADRSPTDDPLRNAGPSGTLPFNRPPRPAPPAAAAPLPLPAPPRPPGSRAAIGVAMILGPMVMGGAMVLIFGNIRFALFALLSPVLAIFTYIESKAKNRRGGRRESRRYAAELADMGVALAARRVEEVLRRRAATPDPAEVCRRAAGGSTRLWERRGDHPDFLVVGAGLGDLAWALPVDGGREQLPPQASAILQEAATLPLVPVPVELARGGVVGIVGDRDAALAVARSLLCQVAVQSGPADVRIALLVDAGRRAAWEWAKWLPHLRDSGGDGRLAATSPDTVDALLRRLLGRTSVQVKGSEATGPTTLAVVDAAGLTEGRSAPARSLLRGDGGAAAGIVLAASEAELPAVCTTVIELIGSHGEARLRRPQRGEVIERLLAGGMDDDAARRCAQHLARFDDPELDVVGAGLPGRVPLVALLAGDALDATAVGARWRAAGPDPGLPATIGVTEEGPLTVDLVVDGPHVLVAGATGAGTSELLRTVVTSLGASADPSRTSFLLVDPRGPAGLAAVAGLPHVVGHVTDVTDQAADRLVQTLDGEAHRRERALASAGTTDIADHLHRRATDPALEPLPRLVVVVDGLATLAVDHPEVVQSLVALAERGPRLGLHLVLATQRPRAPLHEHVRGVAGIRIVLRVQDGADAAATLGTDRIAAIGRDQAGRGWIRVGPAEVIALQVASVCGATEGPDHPVEVAPFELEPAAGAERNRQPARRGGRDVDRAVAAMAAAWADAGGTRSRPLWTDEGGAAVAAEVIGLAELLGVGDVGALDPAVSWAPRAARDVLRVPIGVGAGGEPLHLDLKESAQGGMGPHGLVVGATGSGKSELLRTLVTALAVTHPPEELSFVLVDFKGGATFAGMAALPHVAGMITNLEDDLAMVDRMQASLEGELRRRQELLRAAGNLASVRDHRARRLAGADLEPLPALVVIVDEFAELLSSRPEFIDLFVAIGRLGRSLGMHLLLASQRLDEGRLRGLESHLSYRIGLRTFSAAESRTVLGVPAAYSLPPEPGGGYLKVDTTVFERFRAALVSGPYEAPEGAAPVLEPLPGAVVPTTMDVVVGRLRHAGKPAHQVWLPPLDAAYTLDQVLPGLDVTGDRGLVATGWPAVGRLAVPLGLVDRPEDQARSVLVADLSGAEGNLAIVGAPQSGKSTLLRTLVASLALTHAPSEVQVYGVDYGGGTLGALEGLPHVGTVASRLDPERVRRVIGEVEAILTAREELFRSRNIDSTATFRALRSSGALADQPLGDVFLVIDNWPALRSAFEDLDPVVVDIASRGLGYGVHVVVTAGRWMEIRSNLKDSLGGRLELRLTDPADSVVDRRTAVNVPVGVPGRGITKDRLHFQAVLPRIDGVPGAGDLGPAVAALVDRVRDEWPGEPAPPVRVLPTHLAASELPDPAADTEPGIPIGIGETDLAPVRLDLAGGDPHLLVLGDGESGKTTLLRTFLTQLCARTTPAETRVVVVDYRRTLLEVVPSEHLLAYTGAVPAATDAIAKLRHNLVERLPGADLSPQQLRDRSWWSGPELYVVVDDYDLVVTASGNPLAPLLDLLAQGRDLGLHLVIARRVAGSSRALFEPVLQRVKELGSPGILLSGDRQEGPLLGPYRASEQPPGRGLLVRRKQAGTLVQIADTPQL